MNQRFRTGSRFEHRGLMALMKEAFGPEVAFLLPVFFLLFVVGLVWVLFEQGA